jgi:serine/threonine protein kinase/Tfp pilus assembly protein PilF
MDEESIFLRALQKPTPTDRQAFVEDACAGKGELRRGVERLLQAHERAGNFLQGNQEVATSDAPVSERPGTVIGPYKLLEQIGEGGFGIVFMAEQQQPIRRKVALKVLKPGMDTRQVIARFEAERQALALMDHPNIARVLDAGQTASGRPYFVMDLVKGVPITEFCDQSQLTPRERLELFVHVCQAVQHAHQKGIIHRDIKPTNVLVTMQDGAALVKVIDFGIAKALGQQLTDKTLFTGFAQMIGTPLYMSPEQAALSNVDVDTRSDIYSLGVLLYELLTGTTAFDRERFKEAAYDEIRRIIREEEPPRPSMRLSTLAGRVQRTPGTPAPSEALYDVATIATQRKSDPKRLCQLFRGELDWIVMKALEKDRNRRYETAIAFAADVERYLHDEPVQACPPSALYCFRKFTRRNRTGLAMAGLIGLFLVLLVGSIGWTVRDRAARKEEADRDRAARLATIEEKTNLALDEAVALQARLKWPEALEAAKRAAGFLAVGCSEALSTRVREVRKDLEMVLRLEAIWLPSGADYPNHDVWGEDASYALAFREYGIDVETLEPAEAAERVRARTICRELTVALDTWADNRKKSAKAHDMSWKRLAAVARVADPDPWRNQVRNALEQGDRQTLSKLAATAKISELPMQSLSLLVYRGQLDPKVERSLLRQAQRDHPDDPIINFQLAWVLFHGPGPQDLDEAIRFFTASVAACPRHAKTHYYLGAALEQRGRLEDGLAEYLKAGELAHDNAQMLNNVAWILATCPEPKLRDASRSVELAKKAVELSPKESSYWNTLGVAHYRSRNWQEAITGLAKAEELAPGKYAAWNAFFLAMARWQLGEKDQAGDDYKQAVQWMQKNQPKNQELSRFRTETEQLLGITDKKN